MTTDLSQGKTKDAGGIMITSADRAEITQWYVSSSRFKDVPDIIISEYAVKDMAAIQGRQLDDPRDIKEAARLIVDLAEDASHKKTHTLDAAYKLPEQEKPAYDHHVAAWLVAQREAREQHRIAAGKAGEALDYARINAETAKQAAETGRKAQGRDDAAPKSADGKLAMEERGKLALAGEAALAKTPEEIAAQVEALRSAKTPADIHAQRAAEKAERNAQEAAAKQTAQGDEQPRQAAKRGRKPKAAQPAGRQPEQAPQGGQEQPTAPAKRSLADLAAEARQQAQQRHAAELAAKVERAARELGLHTIGRKLEKAEAAWRKLPEDATAEHFVAGATARQEAREAYRGALPEAEREAWDQRNRQIDRLDASTPASKRMAEIEAARQPEALRQQQAARRAEEARQKSGGRGLVQ